MVSLAAQEWLKQGRAEGMAEGLKKGWRDGVPIVLESQFGAVDPSIHERIADLSVEDLRRVLRRTLTAPAAAAILDGA